MINTRRAFTLVELLVVVAIIGLLSTVAVVSLNSSKVNARNTQRKANMVQIAKALELYYFDNNAYPSTGGTANWHGACTGWPMATYPDSGAGAWIPNFGSYMAQLPHDPNANRGNPNSPEPGCLSAPTHNCFLYTSTGTDYKLLAHCLPEGTWTSSDPFYDPAGPTWRWQVSTPGAINW